MPLIASDCHPTSSLLPGNVLRPKISLRARSQTRSSPRPRCSVSRSRRTTCSPPSRPTCPSASSPTRRASSLHGLGEEGAVSGVSRERRRTQRRIGHRAPYRTWSAVSGMEDGAREVRSKAESLWWGRDTAVTRPKDRKLHQRLARLGSQLSRARRGVCET